VASEKEVGMSTKPITPRLIDRLCSLAEGQLQIQAARSVALDAGALGVMAVNTAVAAIIIDTRGPHDLWIVALVLLGLSAGLAIRVVRLTGAEQTGPLVYGVLEAGATEENDQLELSLLQDLATDMLINRRALARKSPPFNQAQTLLVLAILVELAGQVLQ
jgi:hypothetical protein